jgi:uncharacterized protein (TIGR00266 family)
MEHQIIGTTMPVLEVNLRPGEKVFAESGELSWISSSIQLTTSSTAGQSGGFFAAIGRALSGGSFFMTEYEAVGGAGMVAFAAKLPGSITPLQIRQGLGYLVHRRGFLCGTPGVSFSIGFQKSFGAGIFGGVGFTLQKLAGQGTAFVETHGELVPYDLSAGQSLRVHPGHLAMFEESVNMEITSVPGISNMLFGGDGLFLVQLTGPGKVWLQSMSLANLAHAMIEYLPRPPSPS